MTRDDVIRMACEAGVLAGYEGEPHYLERFAELVAAHEREECAKVCEEEAWRLKKVAIETNSSATNTRAIQASNCADVIRARGTHEA